MNALIKPVETTSLERAASWSPASADPAEDGSVALCTAESDSVGDGDLCPCAIE